MKIFLIGLPGCGKSTTGKQLAGALHKPFVDIDREISKRAGLSILDIFAKYGEAYFRKAEADILSYWCAQPHDFVMATGGGTPCFYSNMETINRAGISFFLDIEIATIAARMLQTEMARRPLFAGQNQSTIAGRVEAMRQERLPFYQQARFTVTDGFLLDEILQKIKTSEGKAYGK